MAYDKVVDSAVLDAGLKQIADAIREKAGTTDALAFPQEIADAIAAIQSGGATIEPLTITENGTYTAPDGVDGYSPVTVDVKGFGEDNRITSAAYLFYKGARWNIKDILLPMIIDCTDFTNMLGTNYEGDTPVTDVPKLDTSKGVEFGSMFCNNKNLIVIPEMDTRNGENFENMFSRCTNLKTIQGLDVGKVRKASLLSGMFSHCKALVNLYLYNIRFPLQIGSGTSWGHLLTVDSLVHTIKELCTVTTSQTLTIGSANLEKIAGLYCRITDDTHEKKTMELCESTDEGAMTLHDYASEKNWLIQ